MVVYAQRPREEQVRVLSSQAPLQANLLASLDAAKLTRGAAVYAKALVDWNDPSCHLRAGSIVVGHILDLEQRSKQNKGSSVAIGFDHAECDGSITPVFFTLFAIVAYPKIDEGAPIVSNADVYGGSHGTMSIGAGGRASAAPVQLGMGTERLERSRATKDNTPATIESGQVIGFKQVKLRVGTGPDGSSVLSSLKGNIRFEGATQLVLMPRATVVPFSASAVAEGAEQPLLASSAPPPSAPSNPAPVASPALAPEIDETSICTAPCSLISDVTTPAPAHASLALSTTSFGYVPHDRREYASFDFESTLNFLDSQNLLFTYDPHKLRQRFPSGFNTESMRTIRAVLLNPATLKAQRILDWQIQGEGQYIWRTGPGHILVHLGHNLRLLGPDLAVVSQIPIPGQLVFVSTSPDGDHIAIGTLHERHTRTMHDELIKNLKTQPEEDVDVQLLDLNFRVLLTSRQSSLLPPPVLSDAGEVRVNSSGLNRWLIREYRWDNSVRTVAKVNSQCRPDLATPLPDAIFLVGCNASTDQNWYRMIRFDGHPILNSHGSSEDIEQSSSSSNQAEFAVRVVRANNAVSRGDLFFKQDLKEQEVSVYRSSDGKRLFFTTNPGVSLAAQSFALSPTGAQLAILSDLTISLYPIAKPDP
jgi:hypothetical protein